MEHKEPLIPRTTPEVKLRLGERALTMTYMNTTAYIFSEPWEVMNHVYHHPEGEESLYIFAAEPLIDQLAEQDFPIHSHPWPSDTDVQAYEKYQAAQLERELEEQ